MSCEPFMIPEHGPLLQNKSEFKNASDNADKEESSFTAAATMEISVQVSQTTKIVPGEVAQSINTCLASSRTDFNIQKSHLKMPSTVVCACNLSTRDRWITSICWSATMA